MSKRVGNMNHVETSRLMLAANVIHQQRRTWFYVTRLHPLCNSIIQLIHPWCSAVNIAVEYYGCFSLSNCAEFCVSLFFATWLIHNYVITSKNNKTIKSRLSPNKTYWVNEIYLVFPYAVVFTNKPQFVVKRMYCV